MPHRIATVFALSASLLCACCSDQSTSQTAQSPAPAPAPHGGMVMNNVIVIANSGSTNTIGYRIIIGANGDASYVSGDGPGGAALTPDLYARLKADIDAAQPLSQLHAGMNCAKSASLGTSTTIRLGGEQSPDVSCGDTEPKIQKLATDVAEVVAFLKIRNTPRGEGKELPPQNF